MPLINLKTTLQIKDPVRGYIELTETEEKILDLRLTQRLRNIRWPAGVYKVYPGADTSLMGHMLGFLDLSHLLFDHLARDAHVIALARLVSLLLSVARGAWANPMEEYLNGLGATRKSLAVEAIRGTEAGDIVNDSTLSREEVIDALQRGIPVRSIRVDLESVPVNPELMDSLERDAYFAGVDYAPLEINRLFSSLRVAKNRLVISRAARYTLDSYLSAGANMFEAVYYHKTVRAAELMLLRILELAGRELVGSPERDPTEYFAYDDLTFHHVLLDPPSEASEDFLTASDIFNAFRRRDLIKVASMRSISDPQMLKQLSTPEGRRAVEREIAEDVGIDPLRVYVDIPDRPSVMFYPGRYPLSQIAMYERGSRGYEFWEIRDVSPIARGLESPMRTIRVYTTRGYRPRVKKVADALLESHDSAGATE